MQRMDRDRRESNSILAVRLIGKYDELIERSCRE
jgi:hypothetical protein